MALPDSVQSIAYTAIVDMIGADPVIAANSVTLLTWTGEKPTPPGSSNLPFVRITPKPAPAQDWKNPCFARQDLILEVETVVEGNDVRLGMNLWEALLRALFPIDQDEFNQVWGQLVGAGVKVIHPTQGSWGVKTTSTGQTVVGSGTLRVDLAMNLKNL